MPDKTKEELEKERQSRIQELREKYSEIFTNVAHALCEEYIPVKVSDGVSYSGLHFRTPTAVDGYGNIIPSCSGIEIFCPDINLYRLKGLLYHELGHAKFTRFTVSAVQELHLNPTLRYIENLLEDIRVSSLMTTAFGSTVMNYMRIMYAQTFIDAMNSPDILNVTEKHLLYDVFLRAVPFMGNKLRDEWTRFCRSVYQIRADETFGAAYDGSKNGEKYSVLINDLIAIARKYTVAISSSNRMYLARKFFARLFNGNTHSRGINESCLTSNVAESILESDTDCDNAEMQAIARDSEASLNEDAKAQQNINSLQSSQTNTPKRAPASKNNAAQKAKKQFEIIKDDMQEEVERNASRLRRRMSQIQGSFSGKDPADGYFTKEDVSNVMQYNSGKTAVALRSIQSLSKVPQPTHSGKLNLRAAMTQKMTNSTEIFTKREIAGGLGNARIMVLQDTSSSMNSDVEKQISRFAWETAEAAIKSGNKVCHVTFDNKMSVIKHTKGYYPAFKPVGGTELDKALEFTKRFFNQSEPEEAKLCVILTDTGFADFAGSFKQLKRMKQSGVVLWFGLALPPLYNDFNSKMLKKLGVGEYLFDRDGNHDKVYDYAFDALQKFIRNFSKQVNARRSA